MDESGALLEQFCSVGETHHLNNDIGLNKPSDYHEISYNLARPAQTASKKTAIFAQKVWHLQAGNSNNQI